MPKQMEVFKYREIQSYKFLETYLVIKPELKATQIYKNHSKIYLRTCGFLHFSVSSLKTSGLAILAYLYAAVTKVGYIQSNYTKNCFTISLAYIAILIKESTINTKGHIQSSF